MLLIFLSFSSFRSVPRILDILQRSFPKDKIWIPHFTSVINWALRVGLARLKNVTSAPFRWIAIVDHSIDLGLKKALVVLRVPLDVFERKSGALTLSDVECIAVEVAEKWDAAAVCHSLKECFEKSGAPCAILKDGGTDLRAGIALLKADDEYSHLRTIDDVGHVCANALKASFSKRRMFNSFIHTVKCAGARLRQTELSFLLPPKIRTKGRFQGITRIARWAQKILRCLSGTGCKAEGTMARRLQDLLPPLAPHRLFLEKFISMSEKIEQFLAVVKNKGLNQETFLICTEILAQMPRHSQVRKRLHDWLRKTLRTQCFLSMGQTPLVVSSDVIESLMGKIKSLLERHPRGEFTRILLATPCMCGKLDEENILGSLASVSHRDLQKWTAEHIPKTDAQKRIEFRTLYRSDKVPKASIIDIVQAG